MFTVAQPFVAQMRSVGVRLSAFGRIDVAIGARPETVMEGSFLKRRKVKMALIHMQIRTPWPLIEIGRP
jgi:hypothetical protein